MELMAMNQHSWEWFNRQVPVLNVEDSIGMVAVDGEEYVAGVVFDNWTPNSVCGHIVVTSMMALRNGFFDCCTDFAFNDRGVGIIYAPVPSNNDKAFKFLKRLGFTEKSRLNDAFKEGLDCVIMELRKENLVRISKEAA